MQHPCTITCARATASRSKNPHKVHTLQLFWMAILFVDVKLFPRKLLNLNMIRGWGVINKCALHIPLPKRKTW